MGNRMENGEKQIAAEEATEEKDKFGEHGEGEGGSL